MTVSLPCAIELLARPAMASPISTSKTGQISTAGCW